jgi:hypothetical protein
MQDNRSNQPYQERCNNKIEFDAIWQIRRHRKRIHILSTGYSVEAWCSSGIDNGYDDIADVCIITR